MVVAEPDTFLLTACKHGYGKRTPIEDYPIKGRGGLGVINIRTTERNGDVVGMSSCRDADDVMFITAGGMIVRSPIADTRPMGRNTQGVRLVNLKEGDGLVGIEIVTATDLEAFGQVNGAAAPATPPIVDAPPLATDDEEAPEVDGEVDGDGEEE